VQAGRRKLWLIGEMDQPRWRLDLPRDRCEMTLGVERIGGRWWRGEIA
jgi:hypothetical protein